MINEHRSWLDWLASWTSYSSLLWTKRCHKPARSGSKLLGGLGKNGLQIVATSCMVYGRDRIKHYMSVVLACSHDGTEDTGSKHAACWHAHNGIHMKAACKHVENRRWLGMTSVAVDRLSETAYWHGRVWLCLSKQNGNGRVADYRLLILAATERKRCVANMAS
jgi:hypothetical protein